VYFCWFKHISPAFANIMLGVVFLMDELTILKNQVIMMQALMCINELPNQMIKQLREQILFTEARIRAFS
jgi:hypothetical protein